MSASLADLIHSVGRYCSVLFLTLLNPVKSFSPVWSITALGFITAVLILLIFRFTSHPRKIEGARNKIKGDLLRIWLFNHDVKLVFSSQFSLFMDTLRYIGHTIVPLLILVVPVAGILTLMEHWYGHRPFIPAERAVVTVELSESGSSHLNDIELYLPANLIPDSPPVRIPALSQVSWRLKALNEGSAPIIVRLRGDEYAIPLAIAGEVVPVYPDIVRQSPGNSLVHFGAPLLPAESRLSAVRITYPERVTQVAGIQVHWLVLHLVTVVLFVLVLMRKFGVAL